MLNINAGSMGSGFGIKGISRMDFAKSLLLKLKKMDILKEVYLFDTRIKKTSSELKDILNIHSGGGTSIDKVINDIIEKDENSIIITDADDSIYCYSDKAYIIGIGNTRFSVSSTCMDDYIINKQLIIFKDQKLFNVDKTGNPI